MTDGQLVRQTLDGAASAYEALVRRWATRVVAVCHARVGRSGPGNTAAEDLAQETLLRGFKALPTLSEPEKFGPWLCGIATRTCLDWLKKSERTEVSLSQPPRGAPAGANGEFREGAPGESRFAAPTATPADQVERQDELDRLMTEVENLPDPLREALMLYYYEDCTYHDLAQRLGVSGATINARLTQARQLLRERLGAPKVTRPPTHAELH
jgi:RNA polymerase sigma-70 factor (ECF subfamily)